MQVARIPSQDGMSGKRERNTLVTCPEDENNLPKGGLILDIDAGAQAIRIESRKALREGPMPYQLVGEVMAHQGYDG